MPPQIPLSPSEQLTQKARVALDLGRPEAAVTLLLQALGHTESGNDAAVVMERLSYAFLQSGDKDAALLWADRAIAASPGWCWAHMRRANTLENMGRMDEAITTAHTALGLSPDLPWISQMLARLYINKKAYAEAQISAARFQELAPENANAYYHTAEVALEKAEGEKNKQIRRALIKRAESDLQTGLALDPESPFLQRLMGSLREKQTRPAEALSFYLEAVRQMPTSDYEQHNVRDALRAVTLQARPINTRRERIGVACCLLQFAVGIGFYWGAWAAYGAAVLLAVAAEGLLVFVAPYRLFLYAPIRQLNPNAKTILLTAALRERGLRRGGFPQMAFLDALFLNLPPLLLRGLWNAGVWAFHFWKLG